MPLKSMKQVTIRLDLRVSEEMNDFLQNEAQSRKLSFEGLILMLIEEQMKRVKQESQRISPRNP
jgi:predicted HicB family RNase H-like nuclease